MVPDGSLCTASAEQIFPRDRVQRNCFEFALYTTRDHDCISNRIGSGIRTCPQCGSRLTTFVAPPTPSMINRATHHAERSSVLGTCFWPLIVSQDAPIVPSIAGTAMLLASAPYRASGLVLWHEPDLSDVRYRVANGWKADMARTAPIRSRMTRSGHCPNLRMID